VVFTVAIATCHLTTRDPGYYELLDHPDPTNLHSAQD
jgi:hypothetical protein